jgi:hypothetical protein
VKRSEQHPSNVKREQKYAWHMRESEQDEMYEVPPRHVGDYGNPVISALPRNGLLWATGTFSVIAGLGAYSYIKRRDKMRTVICGLLCVGSAFLTYKFWLWYDSDDDIFSEW